MAVGWASTAGTLGPMGDNHCCLIAARKETDTAWMKSEKKRAWILFALPFLSFFFTPLHPFRPNPSFLSVRICKEFHKISPFTRLCFVCVCVLLYVYFRGIFCQHFFICLVTWSGSVTQRGRLFPVKVLRKDKPYLPKKKQNTVSLHLSLKYWQGWEDNFTHCCYLLLQNCNY